MSSTDTHERVVINKAGSFDQLRIESRPALVAGPGEVVVQVVASGINYADVIVRGG